MWEEQWEKRRSANFATRNALQVREFVGAVLEDIPCAPKARIPSTMTGAQFLRLGRRNLVALCDGHELAGEALFDALRQQHVLARDAAREQQQSNRTMQLLGHNKVHAALERNSAAAAKQAPGDAPSDPSAPAEPAGGSAEQRRAPPEEGEEVAVEERPRGRKSWTRIRLKVPEKEKGAEKLAGEGAAPGLRRENRFPMAEGGA